ncbi:hypothetical protein [Actinoplanes sp. RD1]|uniref:hypothetical protein n=1 Tax=Actinoplanes sp. RD1 TaxID=3064538 RepID=UPI002741FA32|nr:hypothetical protein [Actinoplanes sp. RD1]
MVDLQGIAEDVPFAWAAATGLARALRAAADECEGQISGRSQLAGQAKTEWRGLYARQFDDRMRICTEDARRLAGALRQAANQVDELARLAREEQDRRLKARQWQREQEDEGFLEKGYEFLFGEDDLPPIPDPVTPPAYTSPAPATAARG